MYIQVKTIDLHFISYCFDHKIWSDIYIFKLSK